jgi:hypothetical protein
VIGGTATGFESLTNLVLAVYARRCMGSGLCYGSDRWI